MTAEEKKNNFGETEAGENTAKTTANKSREKRIKSLLEFITTGLVEKEEATRLALLAGVAGESIFFLGPPGTAKSMVSRRLRFAFRGDDNKELNYFEYLMNQFSTPDEVYGPVSLKALEENRYERITEGYLPDAEIAFLDEIWKAGPAIQNTLLTIINEKKFHNGNKVLKVPLKVLVSASNELPAENQGLEALWDRFLIRVIVGPVKKETDFLDLICKGNISSELTVSEDMQKLQISGEEIAEWSPAIDAVTVPDFVRNIITSIRQEMTLRNRDESRSENEKFYVSDRRWKKIVRLLKTSAFLNNRNEVDLMDCQLISYCIWNTENQIIEAKEIVSTCIMDNGIVIKTSLSDIKEEISDFRRYVHQNFYKQFPRKEKMMDGEMAYVLSTEEVLDSYLNIKVKYISDTRYYDATKRSVSGYGGPSDISYNYSDTNPAISWLHCTMLGGMYNSSFKTQNLDDTELEHDINQSVFKQPGILKARQKPADEKYNDILDKLQKEIRDAEELIEKRTALFKPNQFVGKNAGKKGKSTLKKICSELKQAEEDLNLIYKEYH